MREMQRKKYSKNEKEAKAKTGRSREKSMGVARWKIAEVVYCAAGLHFGSVYADVSGSFEITGAIAKSTWV